MRDSFEETNHFLKQPGTHGISEISSLQSETLPILAKCKCPTGEKYIGGMLIMLFISGRDAWHLQNLFSPKLSAMRDMKRRSY
jgi:hypothetical protein